MDRKRILLIILFILATLGIAFGLYYFFIRRPLVAPVVVTPPPPTVAPPTRGLPPAAVGLPPGVVTLPPTAAVLPAVSSVAKGGVTQTTTLAPVPVLNPTLATDGRLNYYNQNDGRFYRVGSDGRTELLTDKVFYNVQKVTWSPQGDKGIMEYPDGSKILYNFAAQKQVTIPKHWEGFSFSPLGDQIAAKSIGIDPANRWLIAADAAGGNAELIEPLGDNADKVIVNWSPNQQVIAFSQTGQALGSFEKEIILIGRNGERFNPIVTEGLGFDPQWSTTGDKLLYSVWNADSDYKPELWLTNAQGSSIGTNRRRLDINTWADKCAFADNNTLYCAVPDNLPRGAGVEPAIAENLPDTIYKIDLATGLKSVVATTDNNYTVNNLMISADKTLLYFTDPATGALHKINLR